MIDWLATLPHYEEHLWPIRAALGPDPRGAMFRTYDGIALLDDGTPTVVASMNDAAMVPESRPVALVEHGAGQTYAGLDSDGYAGGSNRERVSLFLCPSERVAELNRAKYPLARSVAVGCPRLDALAPLVGTKRTIPPTVAFTWHWRCGLLQETMPALDAYLPALEGLAAEGEYRLLGHAHPRLFEEITPIYHQLGIEMTRSFAEVVARADLLVADNTSALYEAAALGVPVLALDAPHWRDDPGHRLRFYDAVPGLRLRARVDQGPGEVPVAYEVGPGHLGRAIGTALADPPYLRQIRRRVSAAVYGPRDGRASERAAAAVRAWSES